jgi:hypothetical protein
MKTPTHDEVSQRAFGIWQDSGCPDGCHESNWREAEKQLSAHPFQHSSADGHPMHGAAPTPGQQPDRQQKIQARAPVISHQTAPKAKPPESGKPLWDRPHSS